MDLVKCRNQWTCCVTLRGSFRGKDIFERSKLNKKLNLYIILLPIDSVILPYRWEWNNRFIIISNYFAYEISTIFCRLWRDFFLAFDQLPSNGTFPSILPHFTNTKWILHLASVKIITFKSFYNWFKIDILRLLRPPTATFTSLQILHI